MTRRRTTSAAETEAAGAELATALRAGDVVLVSGDLGAGKTTLIRGACRALGVTEPVVSPTFTLGRRYAGRLPVSHLDLFRLQERAGEEVPGLLDEYLDPAGVTFVEWPAMPDQIETGAGRVIRVAIAHRGGDQREIEVAGAGAPGAR